MHLKIIRFDFRNFVSLLVKIWNISKTKFHLNGSYGIQLSQIFLNALEMTSFSLSLW